MTAITHQQPTWFQRSLFIAICLSSAVFLRSWYHFLISDHLSEANSSPDFSAISDIDARKQSFIAFLYPLIVKENHAILQQRTKLLAVKSQLQNTGHITTDQVFWLKRLAARYAVGYDVDDQQGVIKSLLRRVNIIPPSLALAQAANETAWGISRFASEANNYFGQWCYNEGCGLVPSKREEGRSHEVKSFSSAADSVKSYFNILNSGNAFVQLRALRQQLLDEKKPITGVELAAGLSKYSGLGATYVDSIRTLIEANNLQHYTNAFNVSLGGTYSELTF